LSQEAVAVCVQTMTGINIPMAVKFHPELIISTFEYDRIPERGHVYLEKIRFDALSKLRTKLIYQVIFTSVEDRDFMLQSGMERDIEESYGRLDAL
jgi:hypothetical protein